MTFQYPPPTMMTPDGQREAIRIAKLVKAEERQCWINAFRALSHLPPGSYYVEGIASPGDLAIPIDHGWNETPDGQIIDITWRDHLRNLYVPIWRYTLDSVLDLLLLPQSYQRLPVGWKFHPITAEEMMTHHRTLGALLEERVRTYGS